MKLFLNTILSLSFCSTFAQVVPPIEVRWVEYIWERQPGDDRIVFAKDSLYTEVIKNSIIEAIRSEWNEGVPSFEVKVSKMPSFSMRTQPKFNTPAGSDTSTRNIFLQLFDRSITINPNMSLFSATFDVRYRVIKSGRTEKDVTSSYRVMRKLSAPGQVILERYPFHPTEFRRLCDTIIADMLSDVNHYQKKVSLDPACAFVSETQPQSFTCAAVRIVPSPKSVTISGQNAFGLALDSVRRMETGKIRHGGGNTVGGLLTFFSNIDTEKKRSTIYAADHVYHDDYVAYHGYITYYDTRVADRRRVKDDEGYKSVEVSEYRPAIRGIKPQTKHVIAVNNDTAASFTMESYKSSDRYEQMWNGRDTNTVRTLPSALNNSVTFEMEVKGMIDTSRFLLKTSARGTIRKLMLNDQPVFSLFTNASPDGMITFGNISERQLKVMMLICLLAEEYFAAVRGEG